VKVLQCLVASDLDGAGDYLVLELVAHWSFYQVDDQGIHLGGGLDPDAFTSGLAFLPGGHML
jgi:hypothetical protein